MVDRDRPESLAPLGGQDFDAVVDVATGALGWVHTALEDERARGLDRARAAGLAVDDEQALLHHLAMS